MEAFNAACNYVSEVAFREREFNSFRLRRLTYYEVRARFHLPAQLAQHAVSKVAQAYKVNRDVQAKFRSLGAVTYDARVMRLLGVTSVSITLVSGRKKIALSVGGYQAKRLSGAVLGEADLVYLPEKKRFRLHLTLRLPDSPPVSTEGVLGVDLGIRNIAADSDGKRYEGGELRSKRKHHRRLRRRLQKLGTRGARRLLVKRRKKEHRYATHENHRISKKIVARAKGTGRGVAVEDLTGIRGRTTVHRAERAEHSGWAFHQLRAFLEYKCADAGIPCVAVDPRNTSRTCPGCGCVNKRSRLSQSEFRCVDCGLCGHADIFAAKIVATRGCQLSQPNCPEGEPGGTGTEFFQGKVSLSCVGQYPQPSGAG